MHRKLLAPTSRWLPRSCTAAALALLPLLAMAQSQLPLPAARSSYAPHARGFWFTAPTDFVITGLRVPPDGSGTGQSIEVVRLPEPPRAYPASTAHAISLFRVVNAAGDALLPVQIPVQRGQYIGVLGSRGDVSAEAPAPFTTSLAGYPVRLQRLGMQRPLAEYRAHDLWTEPFYGLGRIELHYQSAKPAP